MYQRLPAALRRSLPQILSENQSQKENIMKIYFAGAIRGGREDAEIYHEIISFLKSFGQVLTEHVGDAGLTEKGDDGPDDQVVCYSAGTSTPVTSKASTLMLVSWAAGFLSPVQAMITVCRPGASVPDPQTFACHSASGL